MGNLMTVMIMMVCERKAKKVRDDLNGYDGVQRENEVPRQA